MASKESIKKVKPRPYPFKIGYLALPEGSANRLKRISPWYLLEYLRQEALRRSETVHGLYKKDPINGLYSLEREKYGNMWWLLLGIETTITLEFIEGMHLLYFQRHCWQDMKVYLEEMGSEDVTNGFGKDVLEWDKNYLLLQIDVSFPPEHIIQKLRPYLHAYHREIKKNSTKDKGPIVLDSQGQISDSYFTIPWHPVRKPFFKDFQAWLSYLKCYDLRRCKGLTYGQIALKVYGNTAKRDLAEKAFKRVTRLIECAENHIWPPNGIK